MFGFFFGALCLYGLVRMARGGCGGGRWGRHGWGRHGGHGGGWGWGRGPRGMLRFLFERLETSPGQERVIVEAVEEMWTAARHARGEAQSTRQELAQLLRGDRFDESLMGGMFARHDDTLRNLRLAATGALAKVHEALDPRQRALLADYLDRSAGWRGMGGPYRV